jgi:hypothetical protein
MGFCYRLLDFGIANPQSGTLTSLHKMLGTPVGDHANDLRRLLRHCGNQPVCPTESSRAGHFTDDLTEQAEILPRRTKYPHPTGWRPHPDRQGPGAPGRGSDAEMDRSRVAYLISLFQADLVPVERVAGVFDDEPSLALQPVERIVASRTRAHVHIGRTTNPSRGGNRSRLKVLF